MVTVLNGIRFEATRDAIAEPAWDNQIVYEPGDLHCRVDGEEVDEQEFIRRWIEAGGKPLTE